MKEFIDNKNKVWKVPSVFKFKHKSYPEKRMLEFCEKLNCREEGIKCEDCIFSIPVTNYEARSEKVKSFMAWEEQNEL